MPGRNRGSASTATSAMRSTPWNTVSVSSTIAVLNRTSWVRRRAAGAVGPVRERAAVAVVEPRDTGRDRHAVLVEQAGVLHHDEQPLRDELAIGAAELGNVGVHGELLARNHEVRVRDRRLDDRPAVDRPGRLDERRVVQERLDAVDAAPRCRTRTPRGSSSSAPRAPTPARRRPRGRRCAGSSSARPGAARGRARCRSRASRARGTCGSDRSGRRDRPSRPRSGVEQRIEDENGCAHGQRRRRCRRSSRISSSNRSHRTWIAWGEWPGTHATDPLLTSSSPSFCPSLRTRSARRCSRRPWAGSRSRCRDAASVHPLLDADVGLDAL